jgi:hypothetical protein
MTPPTCSASGSMSGPGPEACALEAEGGAAAVGVADEPVELESGLVLLHAPTRANSRHEEMRTRRTSGRVSQLCGQRGDYFREGCFWDP